MSILYISIYSWLANANFSIKPITSWGFIGSDNRLRYDLDEQIFKLN